MSMGNTLSTAPRESADTASRISPSVAVAVAVLLLAVLSATLVARLTGYDASSVPESPVIEQS